MVHIFQKIINKTIEVFCVIFLIYLWLVLLGDILSPGGTRGEFSENNQMLLTFVIFFCLQILLYIFYKIKQKKLIILFLILASINIISLYVPFTGFLYVHTLIILLLLNFYNILSIIKKIFSK